MGRPRIPIEIRVLSRISPEPNSGCWLWTGKVDRGGYGRLEYFNGHHSVPLLAHRVSYIHFAGPIPEGLDLDHLCRVHCCVNPRHLEPVTRQVNLQRGIGVGDAGREAARIGKLSRTHCKHGHDRTDENGYYYTRKNGRQFWHCGACQHLRVTDPDYRAKRRKPHKAPAV